MNASGIPAGVLALSGAALRRQREAEGRCLGILERAGYEPVHLPVLEYSEGTDVPGYRFVDRSGRLVAVRTDFTPLAARVIAAELRSEALPVSVSYAGEVVRPRPARLRQLSELYQLGFESYGVVDGARAALDLSLDLLVAVGVPPERCHVAVGVAALAEAVLGRLFERPGEAEAELLAVRDLAGLLDRGSVSPVQGDALERALFDAEDDSWAETLGLTAVVAPARALVEGCRRRGIDASLDLAPRLSGPYYTGPVFTVWGERSRAVIAAGGEYGVDTQAGPTPAAGACITLSLAIEEASC